LICAAQALDLDGMYQFDDALGYAFNMIRFGIADHLIRRRRRNDHAGDHARLCVMRVVSASRNDEPSALAAPSIGRAMDSYLAKALGC